MLARPDEEIAYGLVDQPCFFDVVTHTIFYFGLIREKVGSSALNMLNVFTIFFVSTMTTICTVSTMYTFQCSKAKSCSSSMDSLRAWLFGPGWFPGVFQSFLFWFWLEKKTSTDEGPFHPQTWACQDSETTRLLRRFKQPSDIYFGETVVRCSSKISDK